MMSDISQWVKLMSCLIALYGAVLGLIYYFGWQEENSVSEWMTVILYIAVIVVYIRDLRKYFSLYFALAFLLMINRELSLSHDVAEFLGIVELYGALWFKIALLTPMVALMALGVRDCWSNIVIFLRQPGYLFFSLVMLIVALTSQIPDRFYILTRFWLSFEEAGETFLPMMLLVLFGLLKSDPMFREIERR